MVIQVKLIDIEKKGCLKLEFEDTGPEATFATSIYVGDKGAECLHIKIKDLRKVVKMFGE